MATEGRSQTEQTLQTPQFGLAQGRKPKAALTVVDPSLAGTPTSTPSSGGQVTEATPDNTISGSVETHNRHTGDTEQVAVTVAPSGYPYQTVGVVESGIGNDAGNVQKRGTGVLVGRNLLLTSSELAPWGQSSWWMRFAPGFTNGTAPFGWIYVERYFGYDEAVMTPANDYVVCKLFSPVGDSCGWMGAETFLVDTGFTQNLWSTIGLMVDKSYSYPIPVIVQDVKIDTFQDGPNDKLLVSGTFSPPIASDEVKYSGWLGAPLFGPGLNPVVVGLFCSGIPTGSKYQSAWAAGDEMLQLIQYGLANWAA